MKGLEIERKFLVDLAKFNETPEANVKWNYIKQGYIKAKNGGFVRVRIKPDEGRAFLTIKEQFDYGSVTRVEVQKELDYDKGCIMYEMCDHTLEKNRKKFFYKGKEWVVDIFENINLCMAEIELESEDEEFILPTFVLEEVTSDLKYRNENLVRFGL